MKHPDGAGTARTTRAAFDEVWAEKGWQLVDPAVAKAAALLGRPVDDISKLDKPELSTLAAVVGVPVDEKATKSQIATDVTKALSADTKEETAE